MRLMNSRSLPKMVSCSAPLISSPSCFEKPEMTVDPRVRSCFDSAWSSAETTMSLPPDAAMPDGAMTRIMSLPTCSKLVTETPSGKTISRTSERPEPLMVIGCPATTFVGKNTLMPSPRSVAWSISRGLQDVRAPIRTTDRKRPKYVNIFFMIELLLDPYYHPAFCMRLGFFFNSDCGIG